MIAAPETQATLYREGMYAPQKLITICSVYPKAVVTKISRRAPINEFHIPAGSKEKPAYLVVGDTWESASTSKGGNIVILAEHTAVHIVNDQTVHLFRSNASERAYPGIFICKGEKATPEEIEDALGCTKRYFSALVGAARALDRDKKGQEIQEEMRMAGRELGLVGEEWMGDLSKDQQKKCVWCAKFIDGAARKCGECGGFQSESDAAAYATQMAVSSRPASRPVEPPIK